jgi:hypothetical protein
MCLHTTGCAGAERIGTGTTPAADGSNEHVPSAERIRTMLLDWVMYRQPWESTAAKSPREPPLKMSV